MGVNPATGESVAFPVDSGLTDDEIDGIREVFHQNGIDGPEPAFEGYAAYFGGGSSLRFRCYDLDATVPIIGFPIELITQSLTDDVLAVIPATARAGHLALTSPVGSDVCVIDNQPTQAQTERWPDASTISTVD